MDLTGRIIHIGKVNQITEKFKKQEFVIETEGDYPQFIQFDTQQDNVGLISDSTIGDLICVEFQVRGRKWVNPAGETKFFNTLVCTGIINYDKKGGVKSDADISSLIEPQDPNDLPF